VVGAGATPGISSGGEGAGEVVVSARTLGMSSGGEGAAPTPPRISFGGSSSGGEKTPGESVISGALVGDSPVGAVIEGNGRVSSDDRSQPPAAIPNSTQPARHMEPQSLIVVPLTSTAPVVLRVSPPVGLMR